MAIHLGQLNLDPTQMWFGNNPLKEVWVGNNKIWPSGPQSDAKFWFDFNDSAAVLKNRGTTPVGVAVSGTFPVLDNDHVIFDPTTRLNTTPTTNWVDGYTVSMWTKDTPASSGWKTIMHRAVPSGTLTNETYIVYNTTGTNTSVVSGLKFGSVHKEYTANYAMSTSSDWLHVVVVWKRLTTTSFSCTFYVNGVARGTFNGTGYASNTKFGTEQLYIGGGRAGGEWSGRMDDLIIWDRGLSSAEVTELYLQGRSWIPQILTQGPFTFSIGESGYLYFGANFPVTSWSATGLPAGITMASNGYMSGVATTEGSGTMVVTASGDGRIVTKAYPWSVVSVPSLSTHAIRANGASKVSHTGWARPSVTWQLTYADTGAFEPDGTLISAYGRGRVEATMTLTTGRNSRVVSNIKGVLATGSGTSQDYITPTMILEQGERIHLEVEDYSSNSNDRFYLYIRPPA